MSLFAGIVAGARVLAGTASQSLPEHVPVGIIGAMVGAVLAYGLVPPHLTSDGSRYGLVAAGDGALVLMTI